MYGTQRTVLLILVALSYTSLVSKRFNNNMSTDTIITNFVVIQPHWQNVSIVVIGAISGFLSCMGSGVILYSMLLDWKRRRKEVKYRFLLALSMVDILSSPMYLVFTLLMPVGSPNAWGAMGNTTTCDVQGFLLHLTCVGSFYNGALSHWFYCSICKGMTDSAYIERGWVKRWHILALFFPLGSSIYLLSITQFNYTPLGCWIGAYPYGCLHDDNVDCTRGENWVLYAWLFTGIPIIIILIVVAYYMYHIYLYVKTIIGKAQNEIKKAAFIHNDLPTNGSSGANPTKPQADNTSAFSDGGTPSIDIHNENDAESMRRARVQQYLPGMIVEEPELKAESLKPTSAQSMNPSKSAQSLQDSAGETDPPTGLTGALEQSYNKLENRIQETAKQAYWYIGIYMMTHMWTLCLGILEQVGVRAPFWLVFLSTLCWPLQGFGNVFIFLRSRIAVLQIQYPGLSYWVAVYWSIFYLDDRTQKLRTKELPEASKRHLSRITSSLELARSRNTASNSTEKADQPSTLKDVACDS